MDFLEKIFLFILEHKLRFFIYASRYIFSIVATLYTTKGITYSKRCSYVFKNTLILFAIQMVKLASTTG